MALTLQRGSLGRQGFPCRLWASSVGKKVVMAVTGGILLGYVVAHMVGNLTIFFGDIDGYGVFLRELLSPVLGYGGFVWVVRVVLLLAVVLHMTAAVQLARRAARARPVGYARRPKVQGGYAARTMRWGGVILALFVVYHLLDLTAGVLNPHGVEGRIHANVVADFQHWYVVAAYTLAVVALGFHLRHGMWSALRSLGKAPGASSAAALIVAVGITVGFLAVPYAVLFGIVR
ncbi:succinate dehydrogenase cytochrome b subunit [Actinokineospora diospyrosa]|uniref:Succinate dehydrogenase / fumarate reductase cytochrome b subunit n=1 Tax=Actinokineospora diospyrosa TaxID=103728 RepID=A0ABT1IMX3_9PSEU|nr:succinate dehydrogenase cytochrome b subunit [Actinokineospora diospyrosa]MCP2274013.1 succinate dehydrogenase / fumarate reductase cytochrome b subunit [Actinokineospora diospyrosa]